MANKISIVDFVHAMFKSNVVDICKKGDGYVIGTRLSDDTKYDDGRDVLYTFSVKGFGTTADVLRHLGLAADSDRPYFKEGDKEQIAAAILQDIKKRHSNWSDFLDDHVVFKKGGKGYIA